MASRARRLAGHLRTVAHLAANLIRPPEAPAAERWRASLEDPVSGQVAVTGWLTRARAGADLVVLVHGLGGSAGSHYLVHAARVAHALGHDTLRLNLRGADVTAGDFYHGGLTAELHAAVGDRALAGYRRILVLGYSMGGHVTLRFAAEVEDPRVAAVGAICAPLHLRPVSEDFERPSRALYCRHVLRHLGRSFRALERAGASLPRSCREICRARTFRRWDDLTVVPRFGFADADDYYEQASAAAVLGRLRVPCLLVASQVDPVITHESIVPYLPAGATVCSLVRGRPEPPIPTRPDPASLTVVWHPGAGHVAFPPATDLGVEAALGLESQLLGWLAGVPARASERRVADRRR